MISFKDYLTEETPKPTAAFIKRNRMHMGGWASFKHRLMDILGVPGSEFDRWSVPMEWQEAFKRACGR